MLVTSFLDALLRGVGIAKVAGCVGDMPSFPLGQSCNSLQYELTQWNVALRAQLMAVRVSQGSYIYCKTSNENKLKCVQIKCLILFSK